MSDGQVVFWSLRQKFIDTSDMPEQSQQVMYYSLAIGHHVGIIDCLNTELICDLPQYTRWMTMLDNPEAQRKFRGLLTFGEINIDSTHVNLLASALAPLTEEHIAEPFRGWSKTLMGLLEEIQHEPAIYLIVKNS
ncbi:formate hydrogenlyase maturation HycH family protein [Shimwellia blattae]|uniref:Formate hydrogenlyase maturation protein HycH n=1 Tax=Shimwellia blattae (strain ATCC 29907 / DSM 4481 / JCM 1650 / NBRC 105725 / CDC 9005-74) TaxID=630626 RepID=I2BDB3_SHIBC|nr:formate hydrogenlyase maturation HycH family protein [Shimwellia blattae]AFJ48517.1 formate hydrogenlyase maturation protein HycH [Shimwellia blattae DSM 4481 = NBRC 105725]GAB83111.1 NiFe-hydrogenase 4 component J [Shimwellia blattae DSM 4481 = NBRC 105725]VDY66009.1 formate hydrogenlyase maturation protein HycH [Shimwellia blattae]VEC26628.1 formate hydrogenlyase maturation protein HycH [Shimwellia blattae]